MSNPPERLPAAPTRQPDLDDDFRAGLSAERWIASYLPQWTTAERARAHYEVVADGVALRIDADQPDWRLEDAPLRVSNLQTGVYAGPLGSALGTHRHRPDLRVRTETPPRLLFAPSRGRVEITVSATRDADCMVAAWLVGTEHRSPTESGEICIFEIDSDAIGETTVARTGVKAHHDPHLTTDVAEVAIPVNASTPHTWTVIWGEGETVIGCEGLVLRRIAQAPDYPLFLMIDLFEIGPRGGSYPKSATIHRVRAWDGDDRGRPSSPGGRSAAHVTV
ncbi:hypothetical protein IFU40_05985 [Microbacterium sp. CFBP 13617]|uniref:hypothetical protein n=1 Tax=Microbacterium sp. CFBP 13617 TaxID=2774035 RepID=UPI00177FA977|nr:hypothetical protein [Microbacterium sp. CFBP 13617]MBD8218182.1 hypothetical protein [Microbacterium sp. CFBP 13617]